MSDEETPLEGEAIDMPETKAEKPKPAAKTAKRAKSLTEEEADRKHEERLAELAAKRVSRAKPLQEAGNFEERGDPDRTVTIRILRKGEGRVQTGEIDPATNRPSFFAAGAEVEALHVNALKLEAKGYAEITGG